MLYKILAALVLALLIGSGAAWQEHRVSAAKSAVAAAEGQRDDALAAQRAAEALAASAQASTTVVTQYVDRVQEVRVAGANITREVPVYVTATADAACAVPTGFVRIHDAAAAGVAVGAPAGDPDAPAAGVTLSAVADTLSDNYTSCHETAATLTALQSWINVHLPPAPATEAAP